MLRCLAAAGEISRQHHTLQAARVLQSLSLNQQLPSIITSICQQQAVHHSNAAFRQHSSQPQQLHSPVETSLPQGGHSSSSRFTSRSHPDSSSHSQQQVGSSSSSSTLQQPARCSLLQLASQQQQRGYSSLSTGHAHYHARHSGEQLGGL